MKKLLLAALIALAWLSSPGLAAPLTDAAGLDAAMKAAQGGETIMLAAGDYGRFAFSAKIFARPVTIASADPARPARFAGIKLVDAGNLRFADLDIGRERGGEPDYGRIVDIAGGSDIAFAGGSIHGSRDGDPGNDMYGLVATGTARLSATGVRFEELVRGVLVEKSAGLTIQRSDFDLIRSDAINIPACSDVLIAENRMTRFRPIPPVYVDGRLVTDGDHPDAVQGWTASQASGVVNVTIRDNLVLADPEGRTQGFWFGDEANLIAQGLGHRDVSILRNVIVAPLWNAIGASQVARARIEGNIVVNLGGGPAVIGGPVYPWIAAAADAVVSGNLAPRFVVAGKAAAPDGNTATGPAPDPAKAAAMAATWLAAMRAPDPRIAERDALRASIPADTASRDALTRKLAKDRARLKALDKALGQ
jgi:hypothetical protein